MTIRRGVASGVLATMIALPLQAQQAVQAPVESAPVITDRSRATLLAAAAIPGAGMPVVLRLQLRPGWHTYWRNPGDSGEPASVTVRVSGHEISGPDAWPVPERIDIAGIVSYGFHGEVDLVTTVPAAAMQRSSEVLQIEASATWLVCDKVCVPEKGDFALNVPAAGPAGSAAGKRDATPLYPPVLPVAPAMFSKMGQGWTLRVPAASLGARDTKVTQAYFFPERGDLIDHSAAQALHVSEGEIALDLTAAAPLPAARAPDEMRGVLAITRQGADGVRHLDHVRLVARPAIESR